MISRRDVYRYGSALMGAAMSLGLAVPGVAYLLDPLRRRSDRGSLHEVARLNELEVGVPKAFPIIETRRDAWVRYPAEPVGTVWLVRQPPGATPAVVAYNAECPHLGCSVSLAADGSSFLCPCHQARFDVSGERRNLVSPRHLDVLEVQLGQGDNAAVVVRFERFRNQVPEKTPLV